jgi:hypothetical protein
MLNDKLISAVLAVSPTVELSRAGIARGSIRAMCTTRVRSDVCVGSGLTIAIGIGIVLVTVFCPCVGIASTTTGATWTSLSIVASFSATASLN